MRVLTLELEMWHLMLKLSGVCSYWFSSFGSQVSNSKIQCQDGLFILLHQGLCIISKHSDQPKWCLGHRKLELINELFVLLLLAGGLHERAASSLFEVSHVPTWARYLVLASLPSWMTRQQRHASMPDKFRFYCSPLRVIIGCTEICYEIALSLSLQSETFSNYKHHTFKGLICAVPCGVIKFVSTLNTGYVSDIEITKTSGYGIMADKGFLIEKMWRCVC